MKTLFACILTLVSFMFIGSWNTESVANAATLGKPQVQIQVGTPQRRYRDWRYRARGNRIGYGRTFTQDVQRGGRIYRETYRVRNLGYGRTQTVLISRVRLY